ncbi:hypothetical protein C5B86_14810 [Haloferax sp. Atlit-19N]|uniref:SIR2 family protein n=1 Tax=Haloferax sp. Atlit-19N TaxID=2077201 RepID=UPI000E2457A6|nr:SIR2 family protein [Haloferax sp. Atlit-19N]RDZ42954.1 hypothetical protein C5B86_14810 [Haloferax sp. Atlit-19N]
MENHEEYIDNRIDTVTTVVDEMKCQPILFVGSGLSIRYFGGPNWESLLEEMASRCPEVEYDIEYYLQGDKTLPEIGGILADAYYEWAWGEGKEKFPEEFRTRDYQRDVFLKHSISEYLKEKTPSDIDEIQNEQHRQEIELLQEIQPHAIITTNYDPLLEVIFPDYEPIVGEQILRSDYQSIGEILKIHGSVSDPSSIVLTDQDYAVWEEKKKYLSAKLLTYFAEHPVLITGYGVGDSNVKRILADIDEILATEGSVIQNLFFLQWENDISEIANFSREHRAPTVDGKTIRMNHIQAESFDWVFNAFGSGGSIEGVNLKLLRTLMANTYDIIKTKAPRKEIEINYESLSRAVDSGESFGTVFGVTTHDSPMDFNIVYRYRLTSVAEELGWDTWHYANQLIEQIEEETGVNIKESDNQYHMDIAFDREEPQHRYSDAAVDLLKKVRDGESYELDL